MYTDTTIMLYSQCNISCGDLCLASCCWCVIHMPSTDKSKKWCPISSANMSSPTHGGSILKGHYSIEGTARGRAKGEELGASSYQSEADQAESRKIYCTDMQKVSSK